MGAHNTQQVVTNIQHYVRDSMTMNSISNISGAVGTSVRSAPTTKTSKRAGLCGSSLAIQRSTFAGQRCTLNAKRAHRRVGTTSRGVLQVVASGSTGERPFADIVGQPRYIGIWAFAVPSVFVSGWLFVASGLAYNVFGTPHPDEYYGQANNFQTPLITDRFNALEQLNSLIVKDAPGTAGMDTDNLN